MIMKTDSIISDNLPELRQIPQKFILSSNQIKINSGMSKIHHAHLSLCIIFSQLLLFSEK